VALLLAHMADVRDTGRYGESLVRGDVRPDADPMNYDATPDPIRYVAGHRVNHAEAAVDLYRESTRTTARSRVRRSVRGAGRLLGTLVEEVRVTARCGD
jgi:hypothetical protein